jgi:uncharacterized protein (TIGR03790 family)
VNVKSALLYVFAAFLLCLSAHALGPHELLVLANEGSEESVALARRYMEWRRVPECNLVLITLPEGSVSELAIGLKAFRKHILSPALEATQERGIDGHILAWAYSTDFPTRVSVPQGVSLLGATFVRGELPATEAILKAEYRSPLFAGPERTKGVRSSSQTFGRAARLLGDDMPLPSMMLGFTGEHGNTIDEVRGALWRGVESDATSPTGTVYLVRTGDVRSRARQWQYGGAKRELALEGVSAVVTDAFPAGKKDVLGLMTGSAAVKAETVGAFVPGAMADHLTSYAGAFHVAGQSKMSVWIRAGATLTAGTVVEPRALYLKFPTARFYFYYAKGCTAIESFFLSLGSPLQILLLGDPLAAPWAVDDRVVIEGVPSAPVSESFEVSSRLRRTDPMRFYSNNIWLVDGRVVARGREPTIEVSKLSSGRHTLRVVAYGPGLVRPQVFAVEEFEVE